MKPRSYRPLRLVGCVAIILLASSATLSFGHPSGASSSSKKVSPTYFPITGFAGYNWYGKVGQISAQWHVPTIHPSCTAEAAATWVGAQSNGEESPFIQVGTLETNLGCFDGEPGKDSTSYLAFWTDPSLGFHPQILLAVKANDLVSADMTQIPSGWTLTFKNVTRGSTKSTTVHYGVGATFSRGQWIQEDPAPLNDLSSGTDLPYPETSTVQIDDLLVNNAVPTLNLENGQVMIASNGILLVPNAIANDSFSFFQPTGSAEQYLDVERTRDAAISLLDASLARWSHISKTDKRHIVTEVSHTIGESASALAPLSLPMDANNVPLLVESLRTFQDDLSAWSRSGLALQSAGLDRQIAADLAAVQIADKIRSTLGLPPIE